VIEAAFAVNADAAQRLYDALRRGDREALDGLLHPDFVGYATEGMPLDMGGELRGPEAMQRDLWWRMGRHYRAEAQPDQMLGLNDGRLFVHGRY
jgi:2-(1,2-epoxy-1,2-dihydrophenyl)acetyl-CoA isomerase